MNQLTAKVILILCLITILYTHADVNSNKEEATGTLSDETINGQGTGISTNFFLMATT